MKGKVHISIVLVVAIMLVFAGGANAYNPVPAGGVTPIPWGGSTSLPDYAGAPAKAHPIANSGVPQNGLLAPNGFNSAHNDPWMSDTTDFAGPLGRNPAILSTTFADARQYPIDSTYAPTWTFTCTTQMFDSHGRVIVGCFAPKEATVVLADPDTLEVLSYYHLDLPEGDAFKSSGRQPFMRSMAGTYSYLDSHDQVTFASGGKQIVTLKEAGSEQSPVLTLSNTYNLEDIIPGVLNDINGILVDWQGRIWVSVAGDGENAAMIGVLNPATSTETKPDVKWYPFPIGEGIEVIRNTFALTKTGVDRASAYVVTSRKMYRIEAGSDNKPDLVWSAPYDNPRRDDDPKPGQYEIGSGTSPTVLGEGKYVAITDNATPMKVVVYRTDERLRPNEERIVCQVPVFEDQPGQALSNSLVGSRLSLIATNNYYYLWDWTKGQTVYASAPGFTRIDINPNGKGCTKVWTNSEVATTTSPRLSTKTGLIYTVSREKDPQKGVYVYYWIALDFRTGQTVWKKMAGTGNEYDTFYPALSVGPNKALYEGVYGGFMMMRDTH